MVRASRPARVRPARPPSPHLEDWPSPVRHPSRKRWSARERRAGSNPASSAALPWSNGNDTGVRSRGRRFDSCREYVSSEVLPAARPTVTREDQVRVLAGELSVHNEHAAARNNPGAFPPALLEIHTLAGLTTPQVCVALPRLHTTNFMAIFWPTAVGTPPVLARGARLWSCHAIGTRRSRDAPPSARHRTGRSQRFVRADIPSDNASDLAEWFA